jgi:hypothetical protein
MSAAEKRRENPALLEDERLAAVPTEAGATDDPIAGGRRVSDTTNVHDAGSDANDTPDGLTETEEAVRHAAEDIPTGQSPTGKTDSVPIFDRGSLPPRV